MQLLLDVVAEVGQYAIYLAIGFAIYKAEQYIKAKRNPPMVVRNRRK